MEIIKINEHLCQFEFINGTSEFPINITAVIDDAKIFLIDTGYQRFAEQVKQYFLGMGVSEFVVYISHHHEDHFDGCKSFIESPKYASRLFKDDFQNHLQDDEFLKNFEADEYLLDGNCCKTDRFEIQYIYTPGHNKCGFSFLINDKYLYAGDLIFYNKDGRPSIPYLDANSTVDEYLESLIKIKKLNPDCLILGHGRYLNARPEINRQIDNRLFYLNQIKNGKELPLEDCLMGSKSDYCGLNFHEGNLKSAARSK